ncbi:MAG TPA: O-antigen ligase family protein, partial [Anaerolineales bacterium]|nr:O-antigen ligase family protein [Anaerolineales bacterium]
IPFLFHRWPLRFFGLIASFIVLFLLGLGGTTSLPRFFFGDAWEWLTYDRFAFWASLSLTPFFGILFIKLKRKWRNHFNSKPIPGIRQRNFFSALTFSIFTVTALGAWLTPLLFPTQPEPINMKPIVKFLNNADRSQWRYVTFGFGDQFALLNLLTKATTIDGSYHTARPLPELRESGIGQVDTVYWALKGIPAIVPILQESGEHGVRWGFVNPDILRAIPLRWGTIHRNQFVSILENLGWMKLKTLKNGILVYENPKATPPEPTQPESEKPISSFSWGVFPILALVTTSTLGALRVWPIQAERTLRGVHAFIVGLIPVSLCFWYYRTIEEFPHSRVYFTYDSALFFLDDALALFAVILWLSTRIAQLPESPITKYKLHLTISNFLVPLFITILLSSFSILWSTDWRISFYIVLHFWLIFFLVLSLRNWDNGWKPLMYGLCAALSIHVITGVVMFGTQSTAFLEPLGINWPGMLDPSTSGASVVAVPDGPRILRAYGTLPHPNILGGFAFVSLLGPAGLFLATKKPNYPALILFNLGIVLVGLTFSRSAWLGLITFITFLIWKSKYLESRHVFYLVLSSAITIILTFYPLRDLAFTRISNAPVETEQRSTLGRSWLNQQALELIQQHPIAGVGIGSFILEL